VERRTKPLRVAAVLQEKLDFHGRQPPADVDIKTTCHVCSREQNLYEASIALEGGDTIYRCCDCKAMLVVVNDWPSDVWIGNGYRIDNYCIHIRNDFAVHWRSGKAPILFPGSDKALDRKPD
jgi:hypothetical protein